MEELGFPKKGAKHLLQQNYVCLTVTFWQMILYYLGHTLGNKWKVQEFKVIEALVQEIGVQTIKVKVIG